MADTEMVYVTRYALTEGIHRVAATTEPGSRYAYAATGYRIQYVGEGKDWHRTLESAKARAEQMRQAKIASHRKSIEKLERMTFRTASDDTKDQPK